MTFTILTDSTADLNQDWAMAHGIDLLGLTVELDGRIYETVGEHALTSDFLLEKMRQGSKPTTSQINVGTFEHYFREKAENGQAILYIAFSSVLSGTYQSAVMARDLVLADYPEAIIEIIDTQAASAGEGLLVMLASEAKDKGQSLSEVKLLVENLLPRLHTYFLVDDLYHLMRGGRLSKTSALAGSLVNIKPILWIDASGKLTPLLKVRGRKKGIKEMLGHALFDLDYKTVVLAYSGDNSSALSLKEQLLVSDKVTEVLVLPLGPVISSHVGPDTLALFTINHSGRSE